MQGKIKGSADETIAVGIDVAKMWLDIALTVVNKTFRVPNNKKGHQKLLKQLLAHDVNLVTLEATGKYHLGVFRTLHEAGYRVAVVNPYRSRKFADALGQLAKTDRIDAMTLARFGELGELEATAPLSKPLTELAELVHARHAAVAEQTALRNRLGSAQCPPLIRELRKHVADHVAYIKRLEAAIDALIKSDEILSHRFKILTSIPGVGRIVGASLLALLSELGSCTDKQIAALVGVAPMNWDSGAMRGRRAIKGGRASVRRQLYWAAISAGVRGSHPELKTFYDRMRRNGKPAKIAIVAVMRKLAILANTLIAENRTWKPKIA